MVGAAKDPISTLAALGSLYRQGRLVLMGSTMAPVPINYILVVFNSLEIIGNLMYPHNAYPLLPALLRSGQLDMRPITPKVFSLTDLPQAMEYAAKARSLECVVITARDRD
jgi:alcohol dehydrogenase